MFYGLFVWFVLGGTLHCLKRLCGSVHLSAQCEGLKPLLHRGCGGVYSWPLNNKISTNTLYVIYMFFKF